MWEIALRWYSPDIHPPVCVIVTVADELASYRRQGIINHHADSTQIMVSWGIYHTIRIHIAAIKQTMFELGRVSATRQFLDVDSPFHGDNAQWYRSIQGLVRMNCMTY